MRVLVSIVGKRSEHWGGLFRALAGRHDLELHVLAADLTPVTVRSLRELERGGDALRLILTPHRLGEDLTGHMASILYPRAAWRSCPAKLDLIHVIGEAGYPTTWQVLRFRDRAHPGVPVTLYGAQNVLQRFPWPFRSFERRAFRRIAATTPVSADAREVMRQKGYGGRARVVPLGVDTELFAPRTRPPGGEFTVGFVGRLEEHKGVRTLLDAVQRLGCRALVVGDGSLAPALRRRLAGNERVELTGWVTEDELPALLHRMHVLALPSVETVQRRVLPWVRGVALREQFGRVLCEAMSCGVPVVGSRLGEIPHVIGDAGLTSSAGDAGDLAAALARIRDEPGLADRLGEAGTQRARRSYSWELVADSLLEVWREATARRAEPAVAATRGPAFRPGEEMAGR